VPMTTIGRNLPVSFGQDASLWCEQRVCVCVISGFCYKADDNTEIFGNFSEIVKRNGDSNLERMIGVT
jgi:hypothetical protein